MELPQQQLRELTLQLLFGLHFVEADEDKEQLSLVMAEHHVPRSAARLALLRARGVALVREELDEMITAHSSSYDLERIPLVERSILRLALYEMLRDDAVPPKVAIAEAVRLSRKYASKEAGGFINAVLDSVYVQHRNEDPAGAPVS